MTKLSTGLRTLSVFSLTMITIGSVDSIRNLPATALFGSSLIFFFFLAAICFLIPCALVSAELSSTWTERGGIYLWVKTAFGSQMGFVAIWCQWIENVIWYPTILSFIAGTVAYAIDPSLAQNKTFLISIILIVFWAVTINNMFGMRSSAIFASFCSLVGLMLPMALIILLGAIWIFTAHPIQVHFTSHDMLPDLHTPTMWVSLTGIMMSFCGIEVATIHAKEARNPRRDFPKALLYSTVIVLVTLVLGSLSLAVVLPQDNISLVAGIMQAFDAFFTAFHMHWLLSVAAVLLVIGTTGSVSNWVISPTKGLLVAGEDGYLPPLLRKTNRFNAPVALLITQASVVSLVSMVFLLLPTVNASYWLLTALASQTYMVMYGIMFVAAVVLRYRHPRKVGAFRIPAGPLGIWIICVVGFIACFITITVGFFPPDSINVGSLRHYETILVTGLIVLLSPPFILYRCRSLWKK